MKRMLTIQNLSTAYGEIEALKGVSLTVKEGGVTCLLGPNGAGKTTLMMTLSGILKPKRGMVHFEGIDLTGASPDRIVKAGIALVPENRLVFPRMTVMDNLSAGAYGRNDKAGVEEDRERMLARFPRLRERAFQEAGFLSGGEQQMLAVARALMSRPGLLMMDEPSVGLAPKIVQEIFDIIGELSREGTTIFLVEQNVHMALKVASHFYLMDQGRIAFDGAPDTLAEDEVINRAYLGARREHA